MSTDDLDERIGIVTHDEAAQLALTLIDKAFGNPEKPGRRWQASIPADPRRDTDIRMMAYIWQQKAKAFSEPPPSVDSVKVGRRASLLPGLSAAYDEVRAALVGALGALRSIDSSRHEPADERQRAAVAELRRIIDTCEHALVNPPFPAIGRAGGEEQRLSAESSAACEALANAMALAPDHPQRSNLCWLAGRAAALLDGRGEEEQRWVEATALPSWLIGWYWLQFENGSVGARPAERRDGGWFYSDNPWSKEHAPVVAFCEAKSPAPPSPTLGGEKEGAND